MGRGSSPSGEDQRVHNLFVDPPGGAWPPRRPSRGEEVSSGVPLKVETREVWAYGLSLRLWLEQTKELGWLLAGCDLGVTRKDGVFSSLQEKVVFALTFRTLIPPMGSAVFEGVQPVADEKVVGREGLVVLPQRTSTAEVKQIS